MGGRIFPLVFFIVVSVISEVLGGGNGSLTFVIDDTGSMYNDIDQVRASVNQIMDTVFNEKASLTDNMILVTFNDPDAEVRVATRDRYLYKRVLDGVYAHNIRNEDCWEPAMKGVLLGLEKSNRDSYIYVFTDAPARDYRDAPRVIELCQRKQIQLVFVITGNCYGYHIPEASKVYFDIAKACSGLAFSVDKTEVSQVLGPIKEIIKGNKSVFVTATIEPNVLKNIPFTIDDHTDYAIVSVSGKNPRLQIHGPSAHQEYLMRNNNGMVVKLSNIKPGEYVATVGSQSVTSIIIVGRTDFFFIPGFSESKPKSAKDATPQPIADTKVHLSASVTDEHNSVKIVSAEIVQMNDRVIQKLPLKEVSKDFYVTEPFVAPSQMFKVVVNGIIKATGKPIKRFAKLPVTSIPQPRRPPTAVIVEGTSLQFEYTGEVKLTCKVEAHPEPKITWVDSKGTTMKSTTSRTDVPYEYVSHIKILASKNDKYICYAENNEGKSSASATVTIKDPFDMKQVPSGRTNINFGSEGTITCDISSKLPMEIHWYHRNDVTGMSNEIQPSDKYWISASRTQLKIRKMDMDLAGQYVCKAFLKDHKDKEKVFTTRVSVGGLVAPKLMSIPNIKATKGTTAILECKVLAGVPAPKITWFSGGQTGTKLTPILSSGNILRITNVEEKHAGKYKCVAENVGGKDELITTLIVQELPKIIRPNRSTVYLAIEGDATLSIPCVASGLPAPTIIWKLNDKTLNPGKKYAINDGTLYIRDPNVDDTNSYTCVAKNDAGSVSETFKTFVRQVPKFRAVDSITEKEGKAVNIECRLYKGVPTPTVTWHFEDNAGKKKFPLPSSEQVLHISKLESKHAGRYKCVAQNSVGRAEHVITLVVEYPPKRTSNKSTTVTAIEGDLALRVPCDVDAVPRPVITWRFKGIQITPNSKYVIEDGALVIKNPTKEDTAAYTCDAKNYIGSSSTTVEVNVDKGLVDFGTKHYVYLKTGETKKLECDAYKSKSQSIKWFKEHIELTGTFVQINDASYANDGNYTCHVSDEHGNVQTLTYIIDVGSKPKLYTPSNLDDWRGDIKDIMSNCQVSVAKPEPEIKWYFNGKELTDKEVPEIGIRYKWGHYTCVASNVHGSDKNSFDVKSSVCLIPRNLRDNVYMPLLLTDEGTRPKWDFTDKYTIVEENEQITLSCPYQQDIPNRFRNYPKQTELKATCLHEDTFVVNGRNYKLADLQCTNSIKLSVLREQVRCSKLAEKPELIRVGYNMTDFLEIYDVCFDHAKNMPLHARASITKTDDSLSTNYKWFTYPEIGSTKIERGFTCKDSMTSCCYGKSQLLNAKDFNHEIEKKSTFVDYLNGIPIWRPCDSRTTWENIDDMIRKQVDGEDELLILSGTHTFENKYGGIIPRYLWKLIMSGDDPVAIVYVNSDSPTEKDIKCKNFCNEDDHPWFSVNDEYTYCCSFADFIHAFDIQLHGTKLGESSA
uniref:Ig-like domain-containing protein n=1 Tax=Heliothis virescens TaxID=7102 RepID=A0A2A4J8M3_HELVI